MTENATLIMSILRTFLSVSEFLWIMEQLWITSQ